MGSETAAVKRRLTRGKTGRLIDQHAHRHPALARIRAPFRNHLAKRLVRLQPPLACRADHRQGSQGLGDAERFLPQTEIASADQPVAMPDPVAIAAQTIRRRKIDSCRLGLARRATASPQREQSRAARQSKPIPPFHHRLP